jgi:hypothetical protein
VEDVNVPVENPWARIVGLETDRQITILNDTSTNSIPDNGVVRIGVVTIRTFDNPELML